MRNQKDLTSILVKSREHLDMRMPGALRGVSNENREEFVNRINKISQKSRIDILSDQPVAEDAFGLWTMVRTLADVILSPSTETPIAIGVDGEWGTGKTSILKMIEDEARRSDFPCVWLNAWSLESTDSMFMAVASEILDEFRSAQTMGEDTFKISLFDWLVKATNAIDTPALDRLMESIRGRAGVRQVSRIREQEIAELASVATTHRSFEQLIDTLFKNSKYEDSRLVVLIDDLDRALPDQIATILKNLKLILEVPRCVFVLAMDMDVVARSVAKYYRQQGASSLGLRAISNDSSRITVNSINREETIGEDFGYHYLEKLVQIRVEVPPLTRGAVKDYLRDVGIAPEVSEIVKWAPDEEVLNPRRLKRYINWLSVSLQLITAIPMPRRIRNVTALRAMALRHDYPEVYTSLIDLSSKGQRGLKINSPSIKVYSRISANDTDKSKQKVFTFSEEELRKASDALGIDYRNLDDETNNLLRLVTYLVLRSRSSDFRKLFREKQNLEICPGMFEQFTVSNDLFVDIARDLAKSDPVKEETLEFLQYLAKLPREELLMFHKFMLENPILDVSSREDWISRDEKRDSYIAERIRQITQQRKED